MTIASAVRGDISDVKTTARLCDLLEHDIRLGVRQPAVKAEHTKMAVANDMTNHQNCAGYAAAAPIDTSNNVRPIGRKDVFERSGKGTVLAAILGFLPRDDVIAKRHGQAENFIDK